MVESSSKKPTNIPQQQQPKKVSRYPEDTSNSSRYPPHISNSLADVQNQLALSEDEEVFRLHQQQATTRSQLESRAGFEPRT
jgi:hypothetical protein